MHPIESFFVRPSLPEKLEPLRDIAYNLWWYWNVHAIKLFYRLDADLWEEKYHNPVGILGNISQASLDSLSVDEGIQAHLERVKNDFDRYQSEPTWYSKHIAAPKENAIAYFSLEFGLSESIPIYSGGLGILAGDHLKSASDLGIPLIGVGLLYQEGYFRQYLNNDGWQQEMYPDNDFYTMPVLPVTDKKGEELVIEIDFPDGPVFLKVWKIAVGRVSLYLLDTNLEQNSEKHRTITSALYGGDQELRLRQEFILGIGGLRALHSMDIWPSVCHMNEGHAAFLSLERIRALMETDKLTFEEAYELSKTGNVFTTHTPVAAGHDRFPPPLVLKYFDHYFPELGLTSKEFLGLGRIDPESSTETFCMTVLALKCADKSNAVSRLHMHVSRDMWRSLWPGFPADEIPISHITNGVHVASWVSQDMVDLFERYLGPRWRNEPACLEVWERVKEIPDEEIWRTHERRRERLVSFVRKRLRSQFQRRGVSEAELNIVHGALNSEVLTIGFAKRFATYKRADLIFKDIERLASILKNPEKPVQIIFAGKAHPRDDEGKDIIRRIVHFARRPDIRNHIVFIEDYDLCVARYLVQGVDVWLNTPRRPLEASGTSGMKATANGALNLSILDGWWDEAYTPEVGWAIGSGEVYADTAYQDSVESNAIYDILEKDIVPLFYDVGSDGIPRKWISKMKMSLSRLVPLFNTDRMVHEYYSQCYQPALERNSMLRENGAEKARELTLWKKKVSDNWDSIKIVEVTSDGTKMYEVGDTLEVRAVILLGKLEPADVTVELYTGLVDATGSLVDASPIAMNWKEKKRENHVFVGTIPFGKSGKIGYSLRILPAHPEPFLYRNHTMIKWA